MRVQITYLPLRGGFEFLNFRKGDDYEPIYLEFEAIVAVILLDKVYSC